MQALRRKREKPAPGGDTARVRGVLREEGLFLKVHEGAGELDEGLVKAAIFIGAPQPKMFEHIVGFIKLGTVETEEKRPVFSGKRSRVGAVIGGAGLRGVPRFEPGF